MGGKHRHACRRFSTPDLISELRPNDDPGSQASHVGIYGRAAEFLLLDVANWEFDRARDVVEPHVALPARHGAGLDSDRYASASIGVSRADCVWFMIDPREAVGHCASVLGSSSPFDGAYAPAATGVRLLRLYFLGIMLMSYSVRSGHSGRRRNRIAPFSPGYPIAVLLGHADRPSADVHSNRSHQDAARADVHRCAHRLGRQWLVQS